MSQVRAKSEFSFLNGLSSVKDYVNKAVSEWEKTVFLTDTALHWAYDFLKASYDKWVKWVIGLELKVKDWVGVNWRPEFNSVIFYAKNYEWYKELIDLVGKSYFTKNDIGMLGNYLNREDIEDCSDNLTAMIPYDNGFLTKMLVSKDSRYKEYAEYYKWIFWDNLYLEEQPHKKHLELAMWRDVTKEEFDTVHQYLNKVSEGTGIKILPSNFVLYAEKTDKDDYDVFYWIGADQKISDENRISFIKEDHSYKSTEDMAQIFGPKMKNIEEFESKFEWYTIPKINKFPFAELESDAEKVHKEYESIYGKMDSQEFYLRYKSYVGLFNRIEREYTSDELIKLISKKPDKVLTLKDRQYTPEEILEVSKQNWPNRQKFLDSLDEKTKSLFLQLDYELLVVDWMGFNWYFLIVEDYISYCKNNGIPVWPGRWSAAGALLSYALWITDVDPIKHQLLFERFLNVSRISMPDIDVDFDPHYRDRIIDYVRKKYWMANVAEVATFGTMAAKSAIKDVGKFYGENFQNMNRFAKQLPTKPGITIKEMLEQSPFLKKEYASNVKIKKIVDTAMKLEKTKRQLWVHACAVMISPEPLTNFTALQYSDSGKIITQLEAHALEDLGLLKMDFLWLENLSIIDETLKTALKLGTNIPERKNKFGIIDMNKIDYEDPETYKTVFAAWDTTWIFQFESTGMRENLKKLVPDKFDDIAAMVALYRPGPMAFIPSYIKRKHWQEQIEYLNNVLEPIMSSTYGHCVYQEQIIKMVQVYAGYSAGEADILRRAIWKKKRDVIEQQKSVFIEKSAEMTRDPQEAKKIFELVIEPAADYSFNKSHAVAYAMVSFQTAYLKTHYTIPFYQALLNSKLKTSDETDELAVVDVPEGGPIFGAKAKKTQDNEEIGTIVMELREKGINISKPDINTSAIKFEATIEWNIKYGLKGIKSLPEKAVREIINERDKNGVYKDFGDFVSRLPKEALGKAALESLICSGAMDSFGDREEMLEMIPTIMTFKKKEQKNQWSLFDLGGWVAAGTEWKLPGLKKMHPIDKIEFEKKYLWYYVEKNPIKNMDTYFNKYPISLKAITKDIELNQKLDKKEDKKDLTLVGYVEDKYEFATKQGNMITVIKCSSYDYDFEVSVDHALIQKDQILVGNVLKIKEKFVRKDDKKNKFYVKNPFNFESTTYKAFEERVNAEVGEVKNVPKVKNGMKI